MTSSLTSSFRHVACSFLLLAVACGGTSGDDAPDTEGDIAEFEALAHDLESKREVFLTGPAEQFAAAGNTLLWIDASAGDPVLKRHDETSGARVSYGFRPFLTGPNNPNPIDNVNFSASTEIVASMNELDGANVYAVGAADQHLGKITLPAPPYGQKWWAYAVSGGDFYAAVLDPEGKLHLQRWKPTDSSPADVAVFDDLIAPNAMGEFHTFAVYEGSLIFDEGGRIWIADLGAPKATWVKNEQRVTGADFERDAVVYSIDRDFYRFDRATGAVVDLGDKMRKNDYVLNATFHEAHYPAIQSQWSKRGTKIYYEANDGIFAYDIAADTVTPVLLSARDNSTVYRYPTVLEGGALYVKGLESKSGAVGADGPTYRVAP